MKLTQRFDKWWARVGRANIELTFEQAAYEAFLAGRKDAMRQLRPTVVIKHLRYKTAGGIDQFEILLNGKRMAIYHGTLQCNEAVGEATKIAKALKVKVTKTVISGQPN